MKDRRETLIGWLNDAYAMEMGIIPVLENHVKDADKHPEIQTRLRAHLEQTRRQADQVNMLVERLGGSTSAVKTTMGTLGGFVSGLSTGAAPDEIVKNALADYSTEHFEIASYRALIAGAQALGETEVVPPRRSTSILTWSAWRLVCSRWARRRVWISGNFSASFTWFSSTGMMPFSMA